MAPQVDLSDGEREDQDGGQGSGFKHIMSKHRRSSRKKHHSSTDSKDKKVEDNIGRRVYDALNV